MGILNLVTGLFKPAAELIDNIHTSKEEELEQHRRTLEVQAQVIDTAIEFERDNLAAQAKIVNSEAQSEHWLAANWRPITMLTMLALIVLDYFGIHPASQGMHDEMWTVLKIGLGGYVVGRSAEKVASKIMAVRKDV